MNIVTLICVAIGILCLYYDAQMLDQSQKGDNKTVQKIVRSEEKVR